MYRRRAIPAAIAVATVLALLASSCGTAQEPTATAQPTAAAQPTAVPQSTPTGTPQPTAAPQATATPRPIATPAPTATPMPVPAGQLRFAVSTLRNQTMITVLGVLAFNIDPMYDYMIGASAKGELENSSGLATSWEMSPDGKTWSFKFRTGVVFHNGDPLTAKDVLYSLEWYKSERTVSSNARNLRGLIASMETPDDTSLVVKLNKRDVFFPWSSRMSALAAGDGFVYPKNYLSRIGLDSFNKQPVGSGPYKFKDNLIGDRIVFEALDKHWNYGVPKYKVFSFINVPEESTRLALLRAGDIELTDVSRAGAKQAAQAGMRIKERGGGITLHLRLHDQWVAGNPLGNPTVRKALDISIDRQLIVDTFLGGGGVPTIQYSPRPGDPAYEPIPVPPQDLNRAKTLLKEAGYPDGFVLNYVIHDTPGVPEAQEIAEAIAVSWERIGVKVKRSNLAYSTVLQKWVNRAFDVPTVTCCPVRVGGGGVDLNPVSSITEDSLYRVGYAPEILALGEQVPQSSSIDEYIRLSREFGRKFTELSVMPTIAYVGQLYALRPAIGGETWDLGQNASGIRVLELVRR